MHLAVVELHLVDLRLVAPLETSTGRRDRRPVVLVHLVADDGCEGWGECDALDEPTYTAEYAAGAAAVLAEHLVPRLLAGGSLADDDPVGAGLERLAAVRGHAMAKAALEMALLDLELRRSGLSLAAFLGASSAAVPAGATVSLGEPAAVAGAVDAALAAGYERIKVKVAPGRDVASLRELRRAHPRLALVADANGAYRLDEPAHRRALLEIDELGLLALEQPLRAGDLVGHAELAAALVTPIVLDESVEGPDDLDAALALGALDGLSVKPGRLGGILAARRAHDVCLAAGLHLCVGGMFETALARAAHLAVAALPGFDLPGDLGASDRYFAPDLSAPHVLIGGMLAVPDGPGIGRAPDPGALAAATRCVARWRAGEAPGPLSWSAAAHRFEASA